MPKSRNSQRRNRIGYSSSSRERSKDHRSNQAVRWEEPRVVLSGRVREERLQSPGEVSVEMTGTLDQKWFSRKML